MLSSAASCLTASVISYSPLLDFFIFFRSQNGVFMPSDSFHIIFIINIITKHKYESAFDVFFRQKQGMPSSKLLLLLNKYYFGVFVLVFQKIPDHAALIANNDYYLICKAF